MGCAISSLNEQASPLLSQLFPKTSDFPEKRTRDSTVDSLILQAPCSAAAPPVTPLSNQDSSNMSESPGDNVVAMARCNDCGHMVPESNLAIHQAHACGARARRTATQDTNQDNSTASSQQETATRQEASTGIRQRRRHATGNSSRAVENTAPATPVRSTAPREQDVIDLSSSPDVEIIEQPPAAATAAAATASNNSNNNNNNSNEWSCPRCTLLNPNSQYVCGACQYKNQSRRAADPTRRERLVEQQQQPQVNQPPSPGTFVGGGALLGGIIGAAGASIRGDSIFGGVMEGAMSGAMGGAVLGSTTNQMAMQQQQQQQAARASRQRQPQRSSIRVSRSNSGNHTTTTIYSPDGRIQRRVVAGGPGGVDPLLGLLIANAMQAQPQHGMNIDGMSYEQLLEAFPTENRGANERVISSLPVSTVSKDTPDEQANEDHGKCSICLETFKKGDSRMTLPCLHGFHDECVSKWLRANGSCPICKHRVEST